MPNPNKNKGTKYETRQVLALSAYWQGQYGLNPRRIQQTGLQDSGDIGGVSPWRIQAKNWNNVVSAIREGVDGVEKQAAHAGEMYGVAIVNRPNHHVSKNYAVQTEATWARTTLRLARAEALLQKADPEAFAEHIRESERDLERPFP